ncbi:MAG: hypothetical protein IJ511_00430 [Bacteroides sp.]|nr:hypothetical protein [Bacteroides sp.]
MALLMLCLTNCAEQDAPYSTPPVVRAEEATEITRLSATVKGTIETSDASFVKTYALTYSTVSSMPKDECKEVVLAYKTSQTSYTVELEGLVPSTTYYYQFYASNGQNRVASAIKSFKTKDYDAPILTETTCTEVTESSATLKCRITDEGGSQISSYGFAYRKKDSNETERIVEATNKDAQGNFSQTIEGLDDSSEYEVRAYARNQRYSEPGYSEVIGITTSPPEIPVVAIGTLTADHKSIHITASLTNENDLTESITEVGFYWSKEADVPVNGSKKVIAELKKEERSFEATINDLEQNTVYYLKAYAVNKQTVTGYSDVKSVTTAESTAPVMGDIKVVSTAEKSLTLKAVIGHNGGHDITHIGYDLKTTEDGEATTTEVSKEKLAADGSFEFTVANLAPNTTYWLRAYAVNLVGTSHSAYIQATTTEQQVPTVTLTTGEVTSSTVSVIGKVTDKGGETALVKETGFVYSAITQEPTLETASKITLTDGKEDFMAVLERLTQGTTYYIRAYAKNDTKTGYSEMKSVTTERSTKPTMSALTLVSGAEKALVISGQVSDNGGHEITELGYYVQLLNSGNETKGEISLSRLSDDGNYQFTITGLNPSSTYQVRTYATNQIGTGYSEYLTATTTEQQVPTVTLATGEVTSSSISVIGKVTDKGGESALLKESGFVYSSTVKEPTLETGSKITLTDGKEDFAAMLEKLNQGTTYYIRAYAKNDTKIGYSGVKSVTTNRSAKPTLSVLTLVTATEKALVISGQVSDNGGHAITRLGYYMQSLSSGASEIREEIALDKLNDDGSYQFTVGGLSPASQYQIRAFAENEIGTGYSEYLLATTKAQEAPTVIATVETTTATSIALSAVITNNGSASATITEKGFVYSTTNNPPTLADTKVTVTESDFKTLLQNLTQSTTYYIRAYAKNETQTGYSEVISVTTSRSAAPTLSLVSVSEITENSAVVQGQITDNGGNNPTAIGFAYKMANGQETQVPLSLTELGNDNSFKTTLSNLSSNTLYQVRAFAVNKAGTGYSSDYTSFTTSELIAPKLTVATDSVSANFITLSAVIQSAGKEGDTIQEVGFVYSTTNSTPTVADTKVPCQVDGSSFGGTLSNLNDETTYYIRAYARNALTIGYSNVITAKTIVSNIPSIDDKPSPDID